MNHFVSATCAGEVCRVCGAPATHKVGEEIPLDEAGSHRHNFTAYICCEHFAFVLGPAVQKFFGCPSVEGPYEFPGDVPGASPKVLQEEPINKGCIQRTLLVLFIVAAAAYCGWMVGDVLGRRSVYDEAVKRGYGQYAPSSDPDKFKWSK